MSTVTTPGGRQRSSAAVFTVLKNWLGRYADPSTPLVPFLPKSVKLIFLLLIVLNSPSWPFFWHIRLWYYPLKAYFDLYTKGRTKYIDDFEAKAVKAGGIRLMTRNKRVAFFDDCDYNMHLSNSCYAKNADASRMKWCIEAMSPIFTPKCHMAMGGAHYIFVKEIPIGSEYVMETRVGGWDEKWIYLVTEFVIYPKKKPSKKGSKTVKPDSEPAGPVMPVISAPPSGSTTPAPGSGSNTPPTSEAVKKAATLRSRAARSDGGVVCAVVVTEYCVKAGRITVPPRVAFHFSMLSTDKSKRDHARNLLFGSKDQGKAWVRGGWKKEPNADTLGFDIGHEFEAAEAKEEAQWIRDAREGMVKVNEGLSVF